MRSKRINFSIFLAMILCASYLIPCAAVSANANSAQTYWEGATSSGVQIHGGECPLEVENEKLTFDIQSFPANYYENAEELSKYGANVKAEYTFYNPEDYDVTATLVFPFGTVPYYVDEETASSDTQKYKITVGGEEVEKTIRHTLSSYRFNTSDDLAKLHDDYVDDEFFRRDLTVTAYGYEVSGISESDAKNKAPYASFIVTPNDKTLIMTEYGGMTNLGGSWRAGAFVKNGDTVIVYAIGEPLSAVPEWTVYENGGEKKKIDGSVELKKQFTSTFEDLAMSYYTEESGVSRVDWYNARVAQLNNEKKYYGVLSGFGNLSLNHNLMRWYQYELKVPAKSRVVNTVTAPLYPSINARYVPAVYGYNYLVSPAKTWAKFGSLEIKIKTPYYIIKSDGFNFERTEEGYTLSLGGLPDGELEFSLCAEENPKYDRYAGGGNWGLFIGIVVAVFVLVCVTAAVATFIGVKKSTNKRNNDTQRN